MRAKGAALAGTCAVAGLFAMTAIGGARPPSPARPASAASNVTSAAAPLVGRWERVNTCQELLRALRRYGLERTAPAMISGNGYVPGSPKQIARRRHPCKGAAPRRHSHFFRADGQFGSVDYNNDQVDNGPWHLVDANTLRIGSPPLAGGTFRIRIRDGRLHLKPLITAAQKRKALKHPLQFSSAGWMVSVAYPGHAWKRVPCSSWC
jgi:hypothetical protein